ncbi:MAG: bacillithiol biosynthesis cysteine-adding enzyme BshC [Bacteroidota bacterium]
MLLKTVDLQATRKFGDLFLDYIEGADQLKPFYGRFPNINNFKAQIEAKKFSAERRKILCQALVNQYQNLSLTDQVNSNLEALSKPNTFTITTGHQLNLFTGPLYVIYKIVTVINACKVLAQKYPNYNFVPVYWMASEDHDFEEIDHFRFDGKKYQWKTDQKGAVGHFDLSSIQDFVKSVPGTPDFFVDAYKADNLATAVRSYMNYLFGEYGLVVLDADDHHLKSILAPVIQDDLLRHSAKGLVDKPTKVINDLGYKTQVHSRDINFFYLDEGIRERITFNESGFEVLNTEMRLPKSEILELIKAEPEKFSPNVILRPLYQEMILPNLAYVGGPSEVAYWLQLKPVFDHYEEQFPMLMPRNFAMVIPDRIKKKLERTGLSIEDLFKDKHELLADTAVSNADHKVRLNGQVQEVIDTFHRIREQAAIIDSTLIAHVEAQQARTKHRLELIEKKFIRAEKRRQEEKIKQVEAVLDYLFPRGGLQERTDNFLNFYLENPKFIDQLITYFDPFDYRFYVVNG